MRDYRVDYELEVLAEDKKRNEQVTALLTANEKLAERIRNLRYDAADYEDDLASARKAFGEMLKERDVALAEVEEQKRKRGVLQKLYEELRLNNQALRIDHDLRMELGDALWYLTRLGAEHGLMLSRVVAANLGKLRERYPDGFVKGGGVR